MWYGNLHSLFYISRVMIYKYMTHVGIAACRYRVMTTYSCNCKRQSKI